MVAIITAADIDQTLDFPVLCDALAVAFQGGLYAPARHHHELGLATHLVMPAWSARAPGPASFIGTKIVNVFPQNSALGLPAVNGLYVLQSGETGAPLAVMDGARLTLWRTAATSALAARHLARCDASHMLMVGAGALAPFLIRAHAQVRPIAKVTLWNHRHAGAEALADQFADAPFAVAATQDLAGAVREADIISCATLSGAPLIEGAWVQAGAHLDLVGAFTLAMREVDDAALRRARIFIDTYAARDEGGDVAIGLRSGAILPDAILADLGELCANPKLGRHRPDEITLFKSVGAAIEDLAAAILVWQAYAE